jgi:hypothetical protein
MPACSPVLRGHRRDTERLLEQPELEHPSGNPLHGYRGHPERVRIGATIDASMGVMARNFTSLEGPARPLRQPRGQRLPESPTWKILAEALVMAIGYE